MARTSRIGAIDFWRGLVLIAILFDHVPGNGLEYATARNFGYSDSAEAFVFLSGLSVGQIYTQRARKQGLAAVFAACARRALKLYGAHLAMTAAAVAIFFAAFWLTGLGALVVPHGRALFAEDVSRAVAGVALLGHQIGYFNILPLYIALMIWAPIAVASSIRHPALALAVSVGIYAAARVEGINLPNWPGDGHWFFNPFAWQLLFTCGVVAATMWRDATPPRSRLALAFALALLAFAAFAISDGFGLAPGLRAAVGSRLDLGKQDLGLARLAHFLALAYVVTLASSAVEARLGRTGEFLRSLGRHSLPVFALGSLLAAFGQAMTTVAAANYVDGVVLGFAMAYTLVALAASFLLAGRLDCESSFNPVAAALAGIRRMPSRSLYWEDSSSPAT